VITRTAGVYRSERSRDQRCDRGNAKQRRHEQPGREARQTDPGIEAYQDTECGGHAFATLEAEKHREQVADEHSQRAQQNNVFG
jgi:hypothetical protein